MSVELFGDGTQLSGKGTIQSHDGTYLRAVPVGTDGQIITVDSTAATGWSWTTPNTAATNSYYIPIAWTSVTASTASSISFTNLTATSGDYQLRGFVRTNHTTTANVHINLNTATSAAQNYYGFEITISSTTVSGTMNKFFDEINLCQAPGSSATSNTFASFVTDIEYVSFASAFFGDGGFATNGSTGGFRITQEGHRTSSITTLKIFPSGGSFVTGTTIGLYRIART